MPERFCVEMCTTRSFSPVHSEAIPWVSRQQCVMQEAPYSPSETVAAEANALSGSPCFCTAVFLYGECEVVASAYFASRSACTTFASTPDSCDAFRYLSLGWKLMPFFLIVAMTCSSG